MKRISIVILMSLFYSVSNGQHHKQTHMDSKIVLEFIESINSGNVDSLASLMSNDHEFIDSRGNSIIGAENMKKAWTAYFNFFPDYKIEVTDILQNDSIIVVLGYAGGTYKPDESTGTNNYWRVPASWKAVVVDKKVKLWQVYADNSAAIEIVNKVK